MTQTEKRTAATKFYNDWRGIGDEKSDCQRFWIEFLSNVLGINNVTKKIIFEKRVTVDNQVKFIDVYIPETRVLIEQKSINKDLNRKSSQSDGAMRTPFEQARNYAQWMIPNETPLWIVACNFKSFEIHNMNKPNEAPIIIALEEVRNKLSFFDFMFKGDMQEISREMEISVKAGEIVGILYDKLIEQYKEPNELSFRSLNALCVRIVFCLYAEDAGIFGSHMMFHDYLKDIPVNGLRRALIELFKILDTKIESRDKYLSEDNLKLAAFPYVNGGLFADETIEIPPFTEEIKSLLLNKASADFDWSDISPTIFGAVFESTLNPETRRSGGMHYTSIENIHKVIDPLFMDDLRFELDEIKTIAVERTKKEKLNAFQKRIASLKFLDPACGSGNFLTETYISLRRLENEILNELQGGQIVLGEAFNPIQVSIEQFYGIEINDFAVTVAKTALWIAESQMMRETEDIVHMSLDFLPLKTYANIVEGNALKIDWESVVSKRKLSYIMGNPPFIGARWMDKEKKNELLCVFGADWKNAGNLDYVCCWYKKSADYIKDTPIQAAFVSTNSIVQGESVANLWKPLLDSGLQIVFAYRTFRWDSEAKMKAHIHCVIIGFSFVRTNGLKRIYMSDGYINAKNINGYLLDADNIYVEKRMKPISKVPELTLGGQAIDDGNFVLTKEEKDELLTVEPQAAPFIRYYMMGKDFINRSPRYCLWLKDCEPTLLHKCPQIMKRVKNVKEFRLKSARVNTLKAAQTPTLFGQPFECQTNYIAIPKVSSENRRYIPIDFLSSEIIPGDKLFTMQHASMYEFGILTSNVHMAWTRAVCGRLKSDYSYSNTVVYNNFPWPNPTAEQREKIKQTAQAILDARNLYPDSSLADLYDELTMPSELRKAHQQNDRAVMQAYGLSIKDTTEESCVTELMKLYQQLKGGG